MRVALFTECYHPIRNGVVASVDALRDGLRAYGVDAVTVAPNFPHRHSDPDDIVRVPSLPLPTPTDYRLCVPYVRARDRARLRGVELVHAHSAFITGWMAIALARRRGLPLVFTYHTRLDAYAHYAPFDPAGAQRALVALTRRYANSADVVVVPTQAIERALRAQGVRVPIEVVPSAIDVARFANGRRTADARARLGAEGPQPVVLSVARLGVEKNLELALDALARAPGMRLALVGEGPQRAALESRAQELGIVGRVRFLGALPAAELPDLYAAADAFVFPSVTETQGLVLVEALAAGLPVVAAEGEVAREVLAGHGRLAPADPAALAAALTAAVAGGRDRSAVHLALSRYTVGMHAGRILAIYREVIAARAA
jgi:glycosyltransferase involved in cell wall biosynthesis